MFIHPDDEFKIILDLEPYFLFIQEILNRNMKELSYPRGIYLPNKRFPLVVTNEIAIIENKGGNYLLETIMGNLDNLNTVGRILVDGKIVYEGLINKNTILFKPDLSYLPSIIFKDLFEYLMFNTNPFKSLLLYNKYLRIDSSFIDERITEFHDIIDIVFFHLGNKIPDIFIKEITRVYEDILYRIILPIIEERPECLYKLNLDLEKIVISRLADIRAIRYDELESYSSDLWNIRNEERIER